MIDDASPAGAGMPTDRAYSNIEVARLVANVIQDAAQKIGINVHDFTSSLSFEDLCTELLLVSPLDGRIDEFEYATAWWLLQPPGTPLPFEFH